MGLDSHVEPSCLAQKTPDDRQRQRKVERHPPSGSAADFSRREMSLTRSRIGNNLHHQVGKDGVRFVGLRRHERGRHAPIAAAGAAANRPHPRVIRDARRQSHQHNPARLRVDACFRPCLSIGAGLHLE